LVLLERLRGAEKVGNTGHKGFAYQGPRGVLKDESWGGSQQGQGGGQNPLFFREKPPPPEGGVLLLSHAKRGGGLHPPQRGRPSKERDTHNLGEEGPLYKGEGPPPGRLQ